MNTATIIVWILLQTNLQTIDRPDGVTMNVESRWDAYVTEEQCLEAKAAYLKKTTRPGNTPRAECGTMVYKGETK